MSIAANYKATVSTCKQTFCLNSVVYGLSWDNKRCFCCSRTHIHTPSHYFLSWTVLCKDLRLADCRQELRMEPEEPYRSEFLFVEKKRGKQIAPSSHLCPQLFCLVKTLSPSLRWHCWCGVLHSANTIPKASQMSWSMFPPDWRSFKCH